MTSEFANFSNICTTKIKYAKKINIPFLCIIQIKTSKNIVDDLNKEEKLDDNNYNTWYCKIQYLLDELEVTLTQLIIELKHKDITQHRHDMEAYQSWWKKYYLRMK